MSEDSTDSSNSSDDDETIPLDLSVAPTSSAEEKETADMDPFRKALFTAKPTFSVSSELPQEVRALLSTVETRMMPVASLLHLFEKITSQQEVSKSPVNFEASQDDEIVDSLLEEERRAEEDEYVEEAALGVHVSQYRTRRVDRDGITDEEVSSPTVASPPLTSSSSSSSSSSSLSTSSVSSMSQPTVFPPASSFQGLPSESNDNPDIDMNTPSSDAFTSSSSSSSSSSSAPSTLSSTTPQADYGSDIFPFLSENITAVKSVSPISHPLYSSDECEYMVANNIESSLNFILSSLPISLMYFIGEILPTDRQHLLASIQEKLRVFFTPHSSSVRSTLEDELHQLASDKEPEGTIIAKLFRILLYSSCSESSCERVFSRARFIVGKRRYTLSRRALFASLLVSDNALLQLLAKEQQSPDS